MSAPVDLIDLIDCLRASSRLSDEECAAGVQRVLQLERLEMFIEAFLMELPTTSEHVKLKKAFDNEETDPITIAEFDAILVKALAS